MQRVIHVSRTSALRVPIDCWHQEVHYLMLEDGPWLSFGAGDPE